MAYNLKCRHCGADLLSKNLGDGNLAIGATNSCKSSPTGKHILVPTGDHCVYCGEYFSSSICRGNSCNHSPSKKHEFA